MMKRFFNMIPGETTCCILLHGDIGYYDGVRSGDMTRELLEAEATYKKIDIRINSTGGDVYAGIAIFNALRSSTADITLYVDGVAASMASVLALCGKPVYMSKYARLMIHGVSGGCWGNKEELKSALNDIETLEATLCEMYAEKLRLTPEEIRTQYFDGTDHWLTAEEALNLGFIDGIYDAEPIPEDSTPEQVYAIYHNRYNQSLKTENQMFEKLKKRPSFANCATDEDVLRRMDEIENEAGKVPGLEADNETLKEKVEGYKKKEQEAKDAEDEELLNTAKGKGLTEPEVSVYRAALKTDQREQAINTIKGLPEKRRVMQNLYNPKGDKVGAWEKRQEEIRNNLKK